MKSAKVNTVSSHFKWHVLSLHAYLCHIPSRQESLCFPVTNKSLQATEKLAAFLINACIQIKILCSRLAAGVPTGCLTTVKSLVNRLIELLIAWEETNGMVTFPAAVFSIHKAY